MSFSDFFENAVLEYTLNQVAMPDLSNLHVALFSAATADDGTGTELIGNGYARQPVAGFFTVSGVATRGGNNTIIQFQAVGGAWLAVTHAALMDALSGGNMIAHGAVTTPRTAADGEKLEFNLDTLGLTLT